MNLKHLFQIIRPLFLLCFFAITLQAQPTECFDFNELEIGQRFGRSTDLMSGDTIPLLFNSDVITTLEPFTYTNGEPPAFWDVSVVDWQLGSWPGTAPYLFVSNVNMVFDFAHLPDMVSQVRFDFSDGGGEHNISVNGDTLYNVYEFKELPINIAPDVTLTIDGNRLYLDGNIRQLVIGGQELGFDNFCYVVNDVPPMCIDNIVATPSPCDSNNLFYTAITFDYNNPQSDSFSIRGNGQNYGKFSYGQSSYEVGPIEANPNTQYEFVIIDEADPNCTNYVEIGTVFCDDKEEQDCRIYDLWVQSNGCQTDGTQALHFGFYSESPDTTGFITLINGVFHTFFPFDSLADSIGYFLPNVRLLSGIHELTICKESDITCCKTIRFDAANCKNEPTNDCRIFDIETAISECKPNGTVDVILDFNYESLNDNFFGILLNGSDYDTFSLAQLPIILENLTFYPDSNILSICVYQSTTVDTDDNFECCTDIILGGSICEATDCKIFDLSATLSDCRTDNLFDLFIEFEHQNANTAGFDAFIDGQFKSFLPFFAGIGYTFSNLGLTAGEHILMICENDQPDCCKSVQFNVPDCFNNCRVSFIKAEASECKLNGLHDVTIDFEHEALTGDFFELLIGEQFFDTFRLTELPLTIKDVDLETDSSLIEICVYQSSSPLTTDVVSCCVQQEIWVPDCPTTYCFVDNLRKENIDCNDDSTYTIEFVFDDDSIDLSLVKILLNETAYDFERLPSGLFQIKNVTAGIGLHTLTAWYKDDFLDCRKSIGIFLPDCNNISGCNIYSVFAEALPCDTTGYAFVDIILEVDNRDSAYFEIIGNGEHYGVFEYGQSLYTIGPVAGNGETVYEFIIKDLDNPNCKGFTTIAPFNCGSTNDCSIGDLQTEISDCATDGTVDIEVGFVSRINDDSGFNVYINERYIETYGYHQIPFVLNKLDLPAGEHTLSICRNDVENCCLSTEIFIPTCGTCAITNVTAIASDCENEDYFFVDLQFDIAHPSADKFRVVGNSQLYGIFDYGQDHYRLGPLDGNGETMYEFIVQDLENESCASFAELEKVIDCEQGFVWPGDANFDNITNNFDILNIGLAFGKTGPNRISTNPDSTDITAGYEIAWEAKEAIDWEYSFSNGLNAKHADCNGDGIIDEADISAIEENYFFTHGTEQPKNFSEGTPNDPALYVDFPALSDIELGKEIKVPIIFGSVDIPATAYGLAFTLKFDSSLIKDGRIEFMESWLGIPNQDLLTINKNINSDGFIEVALTRKEGSAPFGAGSIGNFIVIIDDIEGFTGNNTIDIQKVQAVDNEGNLLAVHTPKTVLSALTDTENPQEEDEIDITVYPNPAIDVISISYPLQRAVRQIDIRSISGRLIQSVHPTDKATIDISALSKGGYILELQTGGRTVYRKLVKQ